MTRTVNNRQDKTSASADISDALYLPVPQVDFVNQSCNQGVLSGNPFLVPLDVLYIVLLEHFSEFLDFVNQSYVVDVVPGSPFLTPPDVPHVAYLASRDHASDKGSSTSTWVFGRVRMNISVSLGPLRGILGSHHKLECGITLKHCGT